MSRVAAVLMALSLLASAGCGSYNFREQLNRNHPWQTASQNHFYKTFDFKFDYSDSYGKYSETGTMTVVVGDASTNLEVKGKFTFIDIRDTTIPSGTVKVAYDATDELKANYREAAGRFKAEAKPGDEILHVPDELPAGQTFLIRGMPFSVFDREGGPKLGLVGR